MYKELLTHASLILMWDAQTFLYTFFSLSNLHILTGFWHITWKERRCGLWNVLWVYVHIVTHCLYAMIIDSLDIGWCCRSVGDLDCEWVCMALLSWPTSSKPFLEDAITFVTIQRISTFKTCKLKLEVYSNTLMFLSTLIDLGIWEGWQGQPTHFHHRS
jgi:hypothetical protein